MIWRLVAWHARWLLASRDVLATVLLAGATVALASLLALHDASQAPLAAATVLWLVASVGGLLASARLIGAEHGTGGLRGVLLTPVDRRDVFLSRAIAAGLVVAGMTLVTWLLVAALFPALPGTADPRLVVLLVAAALGLGALGALTGWAALSTRAGELIAPVVAIPAASPLIVAGVHATEATLGATRAATPSLTFAAGYAAAVAALAYLVSPHVTEVAR